MKKEKCAVRDKIMTLRMNKNEFRELERNRKKTTSKTNSNYVRKLALNQPVTVLHRNESIDLIVKEIIALKKELNAIGNNLNQAVHKLHTLDRIPEFRNWCEQYDILRKQIQENTNRIVITIHQISESWLQE
ncbi:MAG: plasmid mobilization relaxosome protein MobC [Chitinophagaceae bacterium]|nr:plasmid mobilization relaxosome protein MobC [Chitinophagaceae bacterium]